jgi:hypothetical protein
MRCTNPKLRGKTDIAPVRATKSPKNGSRAPKKVAIAMNVPRVRKRINVL